MTTTNKEGAKQTKTSEGKEFEKEVNEQGTSGRPSCLASNYENPCCFPFNHDMEQ